MFNDKQCFFYLVCVTIFSLEIVWPCLTFDTVYNYPCFHFHCACTFLLSALVDILVKFQCVLGRGTVILAVGKVGKIQLCFPWKL